MPPCPVQGEHKQLAGALAQGVLADCGVKQRDDVACSSRGEIGGCQLLDRVEVQIVQAVDVGLGELFVGEVGECWPAPQTERGSEVCGTVVAVAFAELPRALPKSCLELADVD
jgi:hypothetical protein